MDKKKTLTRSNSNDNFDNTTDEQEKLKKLFGFLPKNGGLPFWLKQLNPDVRIRSSDPKYFNHVEDWFKVLLPKLKPYLYENGGPVIMVQLENEYGSYFECDSKYLIQLRDLVKKELSNDVALFTTDGPDVNKLKCAMIPGVLPAIDFGTNWDVNTAFKTLRKVLPKGPLINNEFYPGWLDHWAEKHNKVSSQETCSKLDQILSQNASLDLYHLYHEQFYLHDYPNPDNYSEFISQHAGYNNAYTSSSHTNFYFDADSNFLEPTLDR
ncbi:hypothetical protein RND71_043732 [Anisodus tanguticus]|uniref:beta-galactosidase n=1 Tax=Anisodus tanguticus TaxID=243964 RepID=A0AAE1URH4_9SOLA|nr:hypothetical protein RND71_043732 [Anisodus tanguticus]